MGLSLPIYEMGGWFPLAIKGYDLMISLFLGEQGFLLALVDTFLSWSPEHLEINQSSPFVIVAF